MDPPQAEQTESTPIFSFPLFTTDSRKAAYETGLPWRTTTAKLESGGRRADDDVVSMPNQAPPVGPLAGMWCGTWVEAEVPAGCPMQVNIEAKWLCWGMGSK